MGKRGPLPSKPQKPKAVPKLQPAAPPAPPDDLSPAAAQAWQAYWRSPAGHLADAIDVGALRRLFGLYAQHERAHEVVVQALVVKGSVGQIRVNPLADHLLRLEGAILRLENELGLTPMARVRMGIALADGSEDAKQAATIIDELAQRRAASD